MRLTPTGSHNKAWGRRVNGAPQVGLSTFHWQSGYGAFSISPSHVEALTRYIRDREQHHRRETFQGEFRRICAKYGVPIDERYVWD